MNESLEARSVGTEQETVQQVNLGSGSGDNNHLKTSLPELIEKVGSHTDNNGKLLSILKSVGSYIWWPAAIVVSPLKWAIVVFSGHEEKIIRAKAEAKKIEADAGKIVEQTTVEARLLLMKGAAEAEKTLAEADNIRADADKKRAEAEQLRAQIAAFAKEAAAKNAEADKIQSTVGSADELAKMLKLLGVQWTVTTSEKGIVQIVVVKDDCPELPPCDDDDCSPKELPPAN